MKLGACAEGLALYDAIAALLPEADKRRRRRIRIASWTPLHFLWLARTPFGSWMAERNLIPGANLCGADLRGADRGSSPPIDGWRTSAAGYLERDDK